MKLTKRLLALLLALAVGAGLALPALAQEADDDPAPVTELIEEAHAVEATQAVEAAEAEEESEPVLVDAQAENEEALEEILAQADAGKKAKSFFSRLGKSIGDSALTLVSWPLGIAVGMFANLGKNDSQAALLMLVLLPLTIVGAVLLSGLLVLPSLPFFPVLIPLLVFFDMAFGWSFTPNFKFN